MRGIVRGRRRVWLGISALMSLVIVVAALGAPASTRRGVGHVVTTREVPLYLKSLDFVDRDLNYRALARSITAGSATDEARTVAVFLWTRDNIRDVPDWVPLVDDHVWHIIVRGQGTNDQTADVFTTLVVYAGVPAYWVFNRSGRGPRVVSLAKIDGAWRVFDVHGGRIFRGPAGALMTVDEVMQMGIFGVAIPPPPSLLRAELQMLGPRLLFEARRVSGFARADDVPVPVMTGAGAGGAGR